MSAEVSPMRQAALLCLVALVALAGVAEAVDRSKFKTCSQSGFCRRHRSRAAEAALKLEGGAVLEGNKLVGTVAGANVPLDFTVECLTTGAVRVRLAEKGLTPRWQSPDVLLESAFQYATPAVVAGSDASVVAAAGSAVTAGNVLSFTANDGTALLVIVRSEPWSVEVYANGKLQVSTNQRGLSYLENRQGAHTIAAPQAGDNVNPGHGRKILDWGEDGKPIYEDGSTDEDVNAAAGDGAAATVDTGARTLQATEEDGAWEEHFGSHRDTKPNGPTSVGVDVTFHGVTNVYGIPEHATSLSLKSTDGSAGAYNEPYRLYNLDVFEYELDQVMALYGSIPLMMGHGYVPGKGATTAGVFWNNPSETYIDVTKEGFGARAQAKTRWMSESGAWDLFLLPGPTFSAVTAQYTKLTGTQALPPKFALAYHQCRWNYKDEADVLGVDAKFEEYNFPYDVLWLDIEHTDGKKYFTWDQHLFPNPAAMQDKLSARGRRMVTIIDPHIKRDGGYHIHQTATSRGFYIKDRNGGDLEGWCWPGSSSYLDFTSPEVRNWWSDQFALDTYAGSTNRLYTWNDMNEPSVFNGPEVSMDKDAKSLQGVEHREWHNLYGFYQQFATGEGQKRRAPDGNTRPFVLSRAFFAGSQRFGAIWTGDNMAAWDHLKASAPMLMTINLAGLSFAGADVGGFFKNPDGELMTRWYQAGAFQPFFRAHSHIETNRREPWLFGDDTLKTLRDIVRLRYTFLPFWYTVFHEAYATGMPVMRPLWTQYPEDADLFELEDQWLVGADLLVKPITAAGQQSVSVLLPGTQPWYDILTYEAVKPGRTVAKAPLDKIPVYQRGGSIVPRQMRPRRSSDLMINDPYTLVVALDANGNASGKVYLDDGISFDFERKNGFSLQALEYSGGVLVSKTVAGTADTVKNTVERVVILGVQTAPSSVVASAGGTRTELTFVHNADQQTLTIRKPDVPVAGAWQITLA